MRLQTFANTSLPGTVQDEGRAATPRTDNTLNTKALVQGTMVERKEVFGAQGLLMLESVGSLRARAQATKAPPFLPTVV